MNVFVAGVHAVGKSFLCADFSLSHGWIHRSASQLIREESGSGNWSADKRVSDAENNQRALISAVNRINGESKTLLLDGHFVLKGVGGEFIKLESSVFSALNLSGVILIEAKPDVIISRIKNRDDVVVDLQGIKNFIDVERDQAKKVCLALGLPLIVMMEPSSKDFSGNISRF